VSGARLVAISPDATPDEITAIVAAVAECTRASVPPGSGDDSLHEWTRAARLTARRAGLERGPWRLSGRIGRRAGA
jgi:hypothetical protein